MPIVVQYRTTPDAADENQRLVEAVFAELATDPPKGLRYAALRLDDGVTFVHIAEIGTVDGSNPLPDLPSFQAFQRDLPARCVEPPQASTATVVVGDHDLFERA